MCNDIITTDRNCNLIINDNTFNCKYVQIFIIKANNGYNFNQMQTKTSRIQQIKFPITEDGFYTLCKFTVPTDEMMPYYYKDGKYYNNVREVSINELLNINPEVSKLKIEYFYYFSTCNLKKCFIKVCEDIFKQTSSICNKNIDSDLSYKRDLLWSALNVIQYMVEMDQYEEAQRLLEEITQCNGLCSKKSNNCGCGR